MNYFIGGNTHEGIENATAEQCLDYFYDKESIQVDTETTGMFCHEHKIVSLQIGDKKNQYFIDVRDTDILLFKDLLESKLCILHNSKFDYKMLKKCGITIERIYDTMLAECVLYCGYEDWGYSLKTLVKRYCNIDMDKKEQSSFLRNTETPFTKEQVEYGLKDVTFLHDIKEKQQVLIDKYDLQYCINLENEVVKAIADIEYNGVILDTEEWVRVNKGYKKKQIELLRDLDSIVNADEKLCKYKLEYIQSDLFGEDTRGVTINYNSPLQVKKISHSLGYKIDSTEEKELKKLSGKHDFFKVLLELRKTNKIVTTYGEKFLKYIRSTGRVHTSFWQVLSTGRVSSGNKEENAPNMQNIPARNEFRNCFKARPGFKWVSIDFSGQEMTLMADRSDEQVFINALNNNEDLHTKSATLLYRREVTKKERDTCKTITFGLCYGMAAKKLSESLSITFKEAENLLSIYNATFPTLMNWLDRMGRQAKRDEKIITEDICKRIRWFPKMKAARYLRKGRNPDWKEIYSIEGSTEREGKNFGIQASGANITKESLIGIRDLIKKYNEEAKDEVAYLICTVHDAIDVEVHTDYATRFSEEMSQIMVSCGNKYLTKVKMLVDTTITDFWSK